jgi:hypothetical protein
VLSELSRIEHGDASIDEAEIESRGWQYTVARTRLFMNLFGPCYPKAHTKHIPFDDRIIIFAQPEDSFDFCGVNPSKTALRNSIRERFRKQGKPYSGELIDQRIESYLYVFPVGLEDPPVRWWEEQHL